MERVLISNSANFMNTTVTIKIVTKETEQYLAYEVIEKCYNEFRRIVNKYTRFSETSELSKLNTSQGKFIKVDEEFFYLVKYMLHIANLTNGVFDPTIIDILEMYGYDKNYDFTKLDNPLLSNKVKEYLKYRPSYTQIELDEDNKMIKLSKNQRIELGAIGKGYAIDCCFEIISKYFNDFLIDAGGDIRANGRNINNEFWKVGLRSKQGLKYFVELNNQSISCSGNWARAVKNFHHLIDTSTGRPKETTYSTVYVMAPTGIESDTWSTVCFLIGPENISKIIPKNYYYLYL
ncbi:MAG: FAD:protein FMN transferase [Candidatus Dojkabacteria bacterium]|nr:FAD:protein FMN transferase [Candidatus Dojkabacteria bacterium]